MPCLQHHAIYPQKVFGKLYFPQQRPIQENLWSEVFAESIDEPKHKFLKFLASSNPYNDLNQLKEPSSYGLGKIAVKANLDGIRFTYKSNQSTNIALTNEFKSPYSDSFDVEQWMKWSQYFCSYGCHRNSRYSYLNILKVNITKDPELSFLSIFSASPIQPGCRSCPRYTASYFWPDYAITPAHPKINFRAEQCYPWYGSIPTMIKISQTYIFNSTVQNNNALDNIVYYPDNDETIFLQVCPVNTYNRVCAHTKKYFYNAAYNSDPDMMGRYNCTPCPPGGYSTLGKEGQWYCQPPKGKIFSDIGRAILESQQASETAWSDREKTSAFPEMECGPLSQHCRECKNLNLVDITPEQFNEDQIFSVILKEENCPVGSFCPDAFTITPCPVNLPWSPLGSWSISNCTCSMGRYLNGSSCTPCTSSCTTAGYYLPRSQCLEKNGAKQDAPCIRCDNIPASLAVADDSGVELRAGFGTCPYHCVLGSEMYTSNASVGKCERQFSCNIPRSRINSNGQYVYNAELSLDRFIINTYSSGLECVSQISFTKQLLNINSDGWKIQPLSCIGSLCNSSKVCYAQNQTAPQTDPSIPWYSLTSSLICQECPNLKLLPTQAFLQIDVSKDLALGISYCQSPNIFCYGIDNDMYYFNKTAWLCQSCGQRESAVCPPRTSLRGGGCLGVNTPFNTTVPSADCWQCPIQVPNMNDTRGRQYLNYRNTSAFGGCSIDPCPSLSSLKYWKRACGADFEGEQIPCSTACPSNNFRKSECSAYEDLICQNCTQSKPGYFKISNCSANQDSEWQICDAGYYCDSSGKRAQCPPDRTTVIGADGYSKCFCKVGTAEVGEKCTPMQCQETTVMENIPGRSLNSTYYMTLDLDTLSSTKCMPCNAGTGNVMAYTRGNGIEVSSCVCPSGYYGSYNLALTGIQCLPCSTSASCSNPKLPASCDNGDLKLSGSANFPCMCAIPPFASLNSPSLCTSTCMQGFRSTNIARTTSVGTYPQVSGSSVYSIRKNPTIQTAVWKRFLLSSNFYNFNNSIKSLVVTGCMDDSILGNEEGANLQVYHYEYVFWTISDPGVPIIFSSLLQENYEDIQTTFLSTWSVFSSNSAFSNVDIIVGMAVSKWNAREPYYTFGNNRDPWIYVAALLSPVEQHGLFYMKTRVFNTTNNQNIGDWENSVYNISLPFAASTRNAIPVTIVHSTKRLGESSQSGEGGLFFTAFNVWDTNPESLTCGGIMVTSPIPLSVSIDMLSNSFCNSIGGAALTTMALTLNQDSSMPLILIALSSGTVLKLDSFSQSSLPYFLPTTISNNNDLIMNNLIVLFSSNNPVYISGITSNTRCNDTYCLKAADSNQLSLVDIQGMPWGTSPTPQTMSLAAAILSRGKALLIMSKGTSIFTIPIYRCPSPTQYWDGINCVQHSCVLQAACSNNMESIDGNCVCKNGYYLNQDLCTLCSTSSYCNRVSLVPCPSTTTTIRPGATSINDCICQTSGNFYNALSSRCAECRNFDSWCPNRWLSLSCPGTFATSSVTASNSLISFPTRCACAPGYTGVNCGPCPQGFNCPVSASEAMNTAAYYTFSQTPLSPLIIGYIKNFFISYFTQTGTKLPNFNSQDLNQILYTEIVPLTNRTNFGIMVMVQIEVTSDISVDNYKGWNGPLYDYLKTLKSNVSTVTPVSQNLVEFYMVRSNRPLSCITGKVPASPPASCICAPGYETQKQQCSACAKNTFKPLAGEGVCVACPIGTVAPIASSACIPDPSLSQNSDTGGGPDIMLLVGGIGGGVVGLICLLFIVQSVIQRTHGNN